MELLTQEILQSLGVSAVLAVFLWFAWTRLKEKDGRIEEMTDNLMDKYEANTKVTENNNKIIADLHKTQEKLIDRFDDFLRSSGGKHS